MEMIAALLVALIAPTASTPPPQAAGRQAPAHLSSYIADADYPALAILRGEEGTVEFELGISAEGLPSNCRVTHSSGSRLLDDVTCRLLVERARFMPARDRAGRAVPDRVTSRIRWVLPRR
jgi:protein TonB